MLCIRKVRRHVHTFVQKESFYNPPRPLASGRADGATNPPIPSSWGGDSPPLPLPGNPARPVVRGSDSVTPPLGASFYVLGFIPFLDTHFLVFWLPKSKFLPPPNTVPKLSQHCPRPFLRLYDQTVPTLSQSCPELSQIDPQAVLKLSQTVPKLSRTLSARGSR